MNVRDLIEKLQNPQFDLQDEVIVTTRKMYRNGEYDEIPREVVDVEKISPGTVELQFQRTKDKKK